MANSLGPEQGGCRQDVYRNILDTCLKHRDGICPACRKLANVQHKIDEANSTLIGCLDERDAMTSALNEQHDPFVSRLPVELASCILVESQPFLPTLDVFNTGFEKAKHIESLFAIQQVNQRWRSIVQATQELWTIVPATISAPNSMASMPILQEWLKRSGEASLYVELYAMDITNTITVIKLSISITQHAKRWRVLHLAAPYFFVDWMSSILSGIHLEQLDHLAVHVSDVEIDSLHRLQLMASPRALTIVQMWFDQIIVDWTKLTHFYAPDKISSLTVGECAQLFRQAPNLLHCELSSLDDFYTENLTEVVAHKVQTLVVDQNPHTFCLHFLFPALQTLHASNGSCIGLYTLLLKSRCNLRELTLEKYGLDYQKLLTLLDLTPDLESLSLDGGFTVDSLFGAISAVSTTPNHLARLRSLTYEDQNFSLNWSEFVALATSLKSKSLWTVKVQYSGHAPEGWHEKIMDKDVWDRVLDVTQGMDFSIIDNDGMDMKDRIHMYLNL